MSKGKENNTFPWKTALIATAVIGGGIAIYMTSDTIFGEEEGSSTLPPPPPTPEEIPEEIKNELPIVGYTTTGQVIYWTPEQMARHVFESLSGFNDPSWFDEYVKEINKIGTYNRTQVDLLNQYWNSVYYQVNNETIREMMEREVYGSYWYGDAVTRLKEFGY